MFKNNKKGWFNQSFFEIGGVDFLAFFCYNYAITKHLGVKKVEPLEDEEYRIIEDEEDIKRRKIAEFLNDIFEPIQREMERENKDGALCGIISNLCFMQDKLGNTAVFCSKPASTFMIDGAINNIITYAKSNEQFDKDFTYQSFQAFMVVNMMEHGVRDAGIDELREVYSFLKSDIEGGRKNVPNLDLYFRRNKQTNKIKLFVNVNLKDKTIKEEVPFKFLNSCCKEINNSIKKESSKKNNKPSF